MTYVKKPAAKFQRTTKYQGKDYGCLSEKSAKFDEPKAVLYDQKAEGRISREQYLSKRDKITHQQEKSAEKSEKLREELKDLEKQ